MSTFFLFSFTCVPVKACLTLCKSGNQKRSSPQYSSTLCPHHNALALVSGGNKWTWHASFIRNQRATDSPRSVWALLRKDTFILTIRLLTGMLECLWGFPSLRAVGKRETITTGIMWVTSHLWKPFCWGHSAADTYCVQVYIEAVTQKQSSLLSLGLYPYVPGSADTNGASEKTRTDRR